MADELSATDAATAKEERACMRAIVAGLADFEGGRKLPLADAKAQFSLTLRHAE